MKTSLHNHKPRWLWLFAALLPVILFGVIRERRSWYPVSINTGALQLWNPSWLNNDLIYVYEPSSESSRKAHIVNVHTRKTLITFPLLLENAYPGKAYLSPDGETVYIGQGANWDVKIGVGNVCAYNTKTGNIGKTLKGSAYIHMAGSKLFTFKFNFSPRSKTIGYSLIYELPAGRLISAKPIKIPPTFSLKDFNLIHVDGVCWVGKNHQMVVLFSQYVPKGFYGGNRGAYIFDSASGKYKKSLQKSLFNNGIGPLTVSRSGKLIGYLERIDISRSKVHIWDTNSWTQLAEFTPKDYDGAQMMEFAPDGKTIVLFGGWESHITKSISLYDWQNQKRQREIKVERAAANMTFSPDGRTLALAGEGGIITLYRVK